MGEWLSGARFRRGTIDGGSDRRFGETGSAAATLDNSRLVRRLDGSAARLVLLFDLDVAFVIDGWAFEIALKHYMKAFTELSILSRTAICCHVTPSQKAQSYQKALRADPSYKPAAEYLAIVLTDLGTRLKLAGNAQEGIQKYYPAYYNLGVVYSEMMQYDMALGCYEKAALERPMYAEAYCNMGVIYKNRGDLKSALACYERCLAVCPNFEIAKNNMAIALTDLGTKRLD
ncbi:unnamed protein product [Camellia sinensis]